MADLFQICVFNISAQESQGLQLGSLDGLPVHRHPSRAADRAGEAAAVRDRQLFRQRFAADRFKLFKLPSGVIARREQAVYLHRTHQTGGAHFRQLFPGQWMAADVVHPLFPVRCRSFLIIDQRDRISRGGNRLQVLAAEDGAHPSPARGALSADDRGITHQVFSCWSDADHTAADFSAVCGIELLLQRRLGLSALQIPQILRIMEDKRAVVDLDPAEFFTLSPDNQGVESGFFEIKAEVSAAVGG